MSKNFLLTTIFFLLSVTNIMMPIKPLYVDHEKSSVRTFIENCLMHHPKSCAVAAAGFLGAAMYHKELKDFTGAYKDQLFLAGLGAIFLGYMKQDEIVEAIVTHEEVYDFDDYELQSNYDASIESPENDFFSFSKSGARVYEPGEITVTFDDVAGLQTAKEELQDIIMYLKDPAKFEKIGAHVPKGILLSGSPGNGKTLLARAVAGEANCHFIYINASEFIEVIVGLGAARVRDLFATAKKSAPCIIFIDEIDAVGRKRGGNGFGSDSEQSQTLNELLAQMDGFEEQENPIIVIGSTNRLEILDSALTRPGRFDRKVQINSPYLKDRYKILDLHFGKVLTDDTIDLWKIARATPGYSGADLANLVNESAILAIRNNDEAVSMKYVDMARDTIDLGRETVEGMHISDEEYWQTAVHEAGHALARVYQEQALPLYKVTIVPRSGALGITFGLPRERNSFYQEEMKAELVVMLAGSVAEEMLFKGRGAGARSDLQAARELATRMVMEYGMTEEFKDVTFAEYVYNQVHLPDQIATKLQLEVAQIIKQARQSAEELLISHKKQLEQLVQMLLEQGTVFGSDVYKLCDRVEPDIDFSLV